MRTFFLLFSILIIISSTASCPPGTISSFDGNICWLLVSVPLDFINAEKYCQSYSGHLTSIHSAFNNLYLADKAKTQFPEAKNFSTGGNNLSNKTVWSWIDGSNFNFQDWDTYEPQNADTQNCLVVDVGHAHWHTADCFVQAPFVCSVSNSSIVQTTSNPNLSTSTVGNNTDSCASKSCGNGNCTYDPVTNNPTCICQPCYKLDSSGSCTVSKPDPCLIYGDYCTDYGGTCFKNATTCTYYCNCPANPTNCSAAYCEPSGNTCGQKFDVESFLLIEN